MNKAGKKSKAFLKLIDDDDDDDDDDNDGDDDGNHSDYDGDDNHDDYDDGDDVPWECSRAKLKVNTGLWTALSELW